MLEQSTIIALLVLSIWYTYQEGEIFHGLAMFMEKYMPAAIHPALFECNVCMTPWYGSVLYVVIYGISWQWPVVVITAMGINAAINKLSPND